MINFFQTLAQMKMLLLLLVVIHFSNLMAQSYNDYNPTVISNIGVDRFNQQLQQQQQQQQQRQQQPNEWIQSRTVAPPTIGQLDLQQQQQSNQFNMRRPPGFVNTPFNSFPVCFTLMPSFFQQHIILSACLQSVGCVHRPQTHIV
jgi:hypothetical protein